MGPMAGPKWWTFGGLSANAMMAGECARLLASEVDFDNFALTFDSAISIDTIEQALVALRGKDAQDMKPEIDQRAAQSG